MSISYVKNGSRIICTAHLLHPCQYPKCVLNGNWFLCMADVGEVKEASGNIATADITIQLARGHMSSDTWFTYRWSETRPSS